MTLPEWMLTPPGSTVFIFIFSMIFSFAISGTQRLLTNPSKLNAWRKEVAKWTSEYREAVKKQDKKLISKLKKKETKIMNLQKKILWHTMRVSMFFFVPILLIWQFFLIPVYGRNPVAYLPGFGPLDLTSWYLVCSFMFSTLVQRALKLTPQTDDE
ncbi:MAG TPA: DUF106 domain-containing protein [Candidatus Bathyarchaeota archaeon]|nr:DUF106 domain-containing protein [Candidatus Bathyarchaeota archaeon]